MASLDDAAHHRALCQRPTDAGENLADLLQRRPAGQEPPLQVGDALAANWCHHQPVLRVHCLAPARREVNGLESLFPPDWAYGLEALGRVYHHDAQTRPMPPEAGLAYHRQHSQLVMDQLHD